METIQYHLAYSVWHWEEWHDKICEEGYDTPEEVELNMDKDLIMARLTKNVSNLRIVKITTICEDVKVIK